MLGEALTPTRLADRIAQGRATAAPMIDLAPADMAREYNRRPFRCTHRLADEPQMAFGALIDLARRLPTGQVRFRHGAIPGDADFDESYRRHGKGLTLDAVLDDFEGLRAYACLYNPERDAEFRPLTDRLLADVAVACAEVGDAVTWYSSYVFLSTEASVTPYHMDREMNFLLQVQGCKDDWLWDPNDPAVLTEAQKDALLAYDGSRPPYDAAIESRAQRFELRPGTGIHHPFIAPHRVHTQDTLSVSLAFTFRTDRSDRATAIHRFNQRLRRIGMQPAPVGEHTTRDALKAGSIGLARRGRRLVQALRRPH